VITQNIFIFHLGNKQATIAPAGQAKQVVPVTVGSTPGQPLKIAVSDSE
jgi:hypothetical protein